jgi:UDP-N-acetylglucosamine 2-epimerase (non-hydrolysing)
VPLIDLIAGARPNFMKIAPIIEALERRARGRTDASCRPALTYRLIHTGQHYDPTMSGAFFEQLDIPQPHVNLEVGSGTAAEQTAGIMIGYERVLGQQRPDLCLVVGDVTSTMACAIVAKKSGVPVAHVEGGLRSGDWSMPEEINRVVTDSLTDYFFTTSETANANLRHIGVAADRVFFVGNTMIDSLLKQLPRLRQPEIWAKAGLKVREYFVLTLHRPANVDDAGRLERLLSAVAAGARGLPVVFPVHPRTRKILAGASPATSGFQLTDPMGYLEFNYLVRDAKAVITDSGGITEETTVLGVPCLTLRDNTERPETVTVGTNKLVGTNPANLALAFDQLFEDNWPKGRAPEKWDGNAGERIVAALEHLLVGTGR